MWLENEKFKQIDHAVVKGESKNLLKLLGEFFRPESSSKAPSACPKCQKPLERKMHSFLEYFMHACPDRHGAWMSPEVSNKVRDLVQTKIEESRRKQKITRALLFALAGIFGMILIHRGWATLKFTENPPISSQYWPMRDFQNFPEVSFNFSSTHSKDELSYFTQAAALLELGASNRMNLDAVLKTNHSPREYEDAFSVYRKKHQALLMKLRSIYVPAALNEFHQSLGRAAEAQIAFYGQFAEAKIADPKADFFKYSKHPALRTSNLELLRAYNFILKHYPDFEPATLYALESRLCWFDII